MSYGDGGYGGGGGGYGGGGGRGGGRGGRRPRNDEGPTDPESEQMRKLFCRGVNYNTTEEGLKSHFEQWGEVESVVIVKDKETQRSRGLGFVTYCASNSVDDAQANRPHNVDGRDIDCKRAMPRSEQGSGSNNQASVKKLFVGGVYEGITEDALRSYFSKFGNVEFVKVITDRDTGKPKGFGFVAFDDHDPVDKCVLLSSHEMPEGTVQVRSY
jgi:RNA recognition motif-containing protein